MKFGPIRVPMPEIFPIDRQHVGDVDLLYVPCLARRAVLCRDVFREFAFCCCNFALSASRGDMLVAVENDPGGLANAAAAVTSPGAEPEQGIARLADTGYSGDAL